MFSLFCIFLFYTAGLFCAYNSISLNQNYFLYISLIFFILGLFEFKLKNTKFILIISLSICSYLLAYHWFNYSIPKITNGDIYYQIPQENIEVTGLIIDEPKKDDKKITLKIKSEMISSPYICLVDGYTIVNIFDTTLDLNYGDKVQIIGDLKKVYGASNPQEFDYSKYLKKEGVFSSISADKITVIEKNTLKDFNYNLIEIRKGLLSSLYNSIPKESASVIGSLVFGAKATPVPKDIRDDFTNLGLAHVLAASGMQITLIMTTGLLLIRLSKINKLLGICLIIPVIIFYMFLTGLPPSILRAGILNIIILLVQYKRENADTYKVLFLVSFGIIIFNPISLFDIGFQFSVLATFGLLYVSKIMEEKLIFLPLVISATVSMIISAQIMVLPLQLYYFGQYSLIFLPANLLASLFVDLLTYLSIITLIIGQIVPFISNIFGTILFYILSLFIGLIDYLSLIPFSVSYVKKPEIATVLIFYILIFIIAEFLKEESLSFKAFKQKKFLLLISSILFLSSFSLYSYYQSLNILKVTFINVSQGDSTLIQTPKGENILIDCGQAYTIQRGEKTINYNAAEKYIVPYFRHNGITKIDKLILTHPDIDHIGGCETLIDNFEVLEVWDSGQTDDSKPYSSLLKRILEKEIPLKVVNYGDSYTENNLDLKVINKIDTQDTEFKSYNNNYAIALKLSYLNTSFLFMSDIEKESEESILTYSEDLKVDVLKVGHHGSKTSTTDDFMSMVRPEYSVISVGAKNRYGHPYPDVLERLHYFGSKVYRTDNDGGVIFKTDGEKIDIITSQQ